MARPKAGRVTVRPFLLSTWRRSALAEDDLRKRGEEARAMRLRRHFGCRFSDWRRGGGFGRRSSLGFRAGCGGGDGGFRRDGRSGRGGRGVDGRRRFLMNRIDDRGGDHAFGSRLDSGPGRSRTRRGLCGRFASRRLRLGCASCGRAGSAGRRCSGAGSGLLERRRGLGVRDVGGNLGARRAGPGRRLRLCGRLFRRPGFDV